MPGLINGHFHSPGNLMKGALAGTPLEIFMLYEVPPLYGPVTSPRLAYVRTMLGALEMLRRGMTAVHDDVSSCLSSRMTVDASCRPMPMPVSARRWRLTSRTSSSTPSTHTWKTFSRRNGAAMDAVPLKSGAELLAHYGHLIARWHGEDDGRLRCAVSCSAPQRVTPDYFRALRRIARARHSLQHAHPGNPSPARPRPGEIRQVAGPLRARPGSSR